MHFKHECNEQVFPFLCTNEGSKSKRLSEKEIVQVRTPDKMYYNWK